MPNTCSIAGAAIALALCAQLAHAATYRWVDASGGVHYSDTPPPPSAIAAEKKKLSSNVVEGGTPSYAAQQATKNFPVTLYTSSSCAQLCADGRALLNKRGVPFKEIAVGDERTREALRAISGSDEVPVLAVGHDVRKGYVDGAWQAALDAAGYPKFGSVVSKPKTTTQKESAPEHRSPEPGPYTPRF